MGKRLPSAGVMKHYYAGTKSLPDETEQKDSGVQSVPEDMEQDDSGTDSTPVYSPRFSAKVLAIVAGLCVIASVILLFSKEYVLAGAGVVSAALLFVISHMADDIEWLKMVVEAYAVHDRKTQSLLLKHIQGIEEELKTLNRTKDDI